MIRSFAIAAFAALMLLTSPAIAGLNKDPFTYTYTETREVTVRYDYGGHFSEGLAWVKLDGKWFHIRPDGSRAD